MGKDGQEREGGKKWARKLGWERMGRKVSWERKTRIEENGTGRIVGGKGYRQEANSSLEICPLILNAAVLQQWKLYWFVENIISQWNSNMLVGINLLFVN